MFDAAAIGERLRTQDNRITADPIFLVQQKTRRYGIDPDCDPEMTWLLDDEAVEPGAETRARLSLEYDKTGREPEGYRFVGYVDEWVYVQPFFTEAAADLFIKQMRHRYGELRVYVDCGYRNWEWQAVRTALLKGLVLAPEICDALKVVECAMLDERWDSFKTPELWKAQISITDLLKSLTPKGPNP